MALNIIPNETASLTGDDIRLRRFNSRVWCVIGAASAFGSLALVTGGLLASWHFTGRTQHEYLFFAGMSFIALYWVAVICRATMNILEEFYTKSTCRADEAERQNFVLRSQIIEGMRARSPLGLEGGGRGAGKMRAQSPSASIVHKGSIN